MGVMLDDTSRDSTKCIRQGLARLHIAGRPNLKFQSQSRLFGGAVPGDNQFFLDGGDNGPINYSCCSHFPRKRRRCSVTVVSWCALITAYINLQENPERVSITPYRINGVHQRLLRTPSNSRGVVLSTPPPSPTSVKSAALTK